MAEENERDDVKGNEAKTVQNEDFTGSSFFCLKIDDKIIDKGTFQIDSPYINTLKYEVKKIDNLILLRVYFYGWNKYVNFINVLNQRSFKIIFKKGNEIYLKTTDFIADINNINFYYNISQNKIIKSPEIQYPTSIEQYDAYNKLLEKNEILFINTRKYLKENLEMELYIHLFEVAQNRVDTLLDVLDNFPNSQIKVRYNKNKPLKKINFETLKYYKNYFKLALIYSVINDSTELLNDLKEDYINILFKYNYLNINNQLIIKANIFMFLLPKLDKIENIKNLFRYSESIPSLFNNILNYGLDRIKFNLNILTLNDIPAFDVKDNLLDLIEKSEKIKALFKENEIIKLFRKYLYVLITKNNITFL